MKKFSLIAFLLCCLSVATFAQAIGLRVVNNSPCRVYYRVVGAEPCQCGEIYSSNVISLPPGGSIFYATSTTLGGSFPTGSKKSIVAAYLYGNPTCGGAVGRVGEPPCQYPISFVYRALHPDCSVCGVVNANWTPAVNCEQPAALIFS